MKMHGDFHPNVFDPKKGAFSYLDTYAYLHFRTRRISNTGTWVKYSWKNIGSSGIMHSADFQPNVFFDLLVVNYINPSTVASNYSCPNINFLVVQKATTVA